MFQLVLGVHLLLCIFLIGLVLLQQGKGADAGAVLGGGSNTLFGAGGATSLMVKVTTAVAVLFMVTSIFLVRGYSELLETAPAGVQVKDPGLAETPVAGAPAEAAAPKTDETGSSQGTSPATGSTGAGAPAAPEAEAQPQK